MCEFCKEQKNRYAEDNKIPDVSKSELNGLLDDLRDLIDKWDQDGAYLNNPHDDPEDRAGGRVYQECAKLLRDTLIGRQL